MAEIINLSQAPDDIKKLAAQKGLDPEDAMFVFDQESGKAEFRSKKELGDMKGLLQTLAGETGMNIIPSLGAAAGGAAGGALAGAGTITAGPVAIPASVAAGVPAAIAAGLGTAKLQDSVARKFAPDLMTEMDLRRLANPRTATLGNILGGFSAGMSGIRTLARGGVKQAAIPVAAGVGLEGYSQLSSEGKLDPVRLATAGAGGLAQLRNTRLGQAAEDIGAGLANKAMNRAASVTRPVTPNRPMADISKDIKSAYDSGQLTEGSPLHLKLAEELDQPGTPLDRLLMVADKHIKQNLADNPSERINAADRIWEAVKVKAMDPASLPQSKLETQYAELIKDGNVSSKEELLRLAGARDLTEELNILKREKIDAAGNPPILPGQKMTDEQLDILLKASPDVEPPNATPLDKAILEGRKAGYVTLPEHVRTLETAYALGPERLKPTQRMLWEEAQSAVKGPTAEDAARAYQARDTEFFTKDFPKRVTELKAEQAALKNAETIANDITAPEATKAIYRNKLLADKKSLEQKWRQLLDDATKRYEDVDIPETLPPAHLSETPPVIPPEAALPGVKALGYPEPQKLLGYPSPVPVGDPYTPKGTIVTPEPRPVKGLLGPTTDQAYQGSKPVLERSPYPQNDPLTPAHQQALIDQANDVRYGGLPPVVAKKLAKMVAYLPKQVVNFLHDGSVLGKRVWAGTKPVLDRIRELGPSGEVIGDLDFKMRRDTVKTFNTPAALYADAFNSLNKRELNRVNRYLNDAFDNDGLSFITPTAKEQIAIDKVRRGLLYLVNNGIIRGGPGVREGAMYRNQQINPNYIPTVMDSKIRDLLKVDRPDSPEVKALLAEWEGWYGKRLGLTADESRDLLKNYLSATGAKADINDAAKFGSLTKAEGVGLPPGFRADPRKALMYHAFRAAKNFAWFTHVQKDPVAAKVLGETDDGWGGVIDTSQVALDTISGKAPVEAWKQETNGHLIADDGVIRGLTRFANSLQLGPLTGIRDLLGTPGHMAELIGVDEMGKVMTALKNVMTGDVRGVMEKAGDIRAKTAQPFEFNTTQFSEGVLDRVLEQIRSKTGRNLLESTARQWAYETGRLIAGARISKGDYKIFEDLKIPGWRQMKPDDLMEALGSRFVENAQGNYGAGGLPSYLLNSSKEPGIRMLFNLQRWGTERFNNWHRNAWEPAVNKGNFKPMIKSVLGALATGSVLNTVQDYLFEQKPNEMTWREFMRADDVSNKEVAYTLFSKLQNVGFAGVFSQLGLAGTQLASGEVPNGIANLGVDLVGKTATRIGQAGHAITTRGAGGFDVLGDLLDSIAKDNIQAYRLIANSRKPDTGNREERIYRRQTGQGNIASSTASMLSNPMDPLGELRKATTTQEIEEALPKAGRAFARDPSMDPRIQSPMRSLTSKRPGQPAYYDFVGQLQGPEAGAEALQRDQQQARLSLLKKQQIQQLKWQSQIVGGPR
jgi:hypothetical protein